MRRGLLLAAVASGCIGLAACAGRAPDRIFYVALGASDAAGIGALPPTNGYVFRIREELDDRVDEVPLVNLGVPGAHARVIERAAELFLETGREPDLVTLWTGANDVIGGDDPEDFEDDLEDILAQLRGETDAVIVVANVPDLTRLPRFRDDPDRDVTPERIAAFNEAIARQADRFDASLVDLFAEDVEDDLVSDIDGFHPNNDGHRRLAQLFLEAILPEFGL